MKKLVLAILTVAAFSTYALASSASSVYKQMGSVAALSEICLQSNKIPTRLNIALQSAGLDQEVMDSLIDSYNKGYKKSLLSNKIWIASKEIWNKTPFNCADSNDLKSIEKMEQQILSTL
jgi:hypothetical protein